MRRVLITSALHLAALALTARGGTPEIVEYREPDWPDFACDPSEATIQAPKTYSPRERFERKRATSMKMKQRKR